MDSSLHTSISLEEDNDKTIEPVVIPETQLDVYGIIPATPGPSMSRDSKSRGGAPPIPTPRDGQSQKYTSYNCTPMLLSQIVSSSDIPTSGKWSLKKKKYSSAGVNRSQKVKNKSKQRTLVVGSNKNTSVSSNRKYHVFVTRVSVNTDDECVEQYIEN